MKLPSPSRPRLISTSACGRMLFQILTIIGNPKPPGRSVNFERVSQTEVTKLVMMPVALAVCGNIHERTGATMMRRRLGQPVHQQRTRRQGLLKGDSAREFLIIKENGNRASRAIAMEVAISNARVDPAAGNIVPLVFAQAGPNSDRTALTEVVLTNRDRQECLSYSERAPLAGAQGSQSAHPLRSANP